MTKYVDKDTLEIVSHIALQKKHKRYKAVDFSPEELAEMNAAELSEPSMSDGVATGKAVLNGEVYDREYRPYNQEELDQQAKELVRQQKLDGVLFEGVMCSATADDMFGLAAIKPYVLSGKSISYHFDNGNSLTLTPENVAEFEAVWFPFRQSFFL